MDTDLDCEVASSESGSFLLGNELTLNVDSDVLPILDAIVLSFIVVESHRRDSNGHNGVNLC